jgi:hypothetical protein
MRDRDRWWAFLQGKPESEWDPPKRTKTNLRTKSSHPPRDNDYLNYVDTQREPADLAAIDTGPEDLANLGPSQSIQEASGVVLQSEESEPLVSSSDADVQRVRFSLSQGSRTDTPSLAQY